MIVRSLSFSLQGKTIKENMLEHLIVVIITQMNTVLNRNIHIFLTEIILRRMFATMMK